MLSVDEVDGADDEDPDMDDFDRLRSIREQHRREKYLQKLMARSVSAQQVHIYYILSFFIHINIFIINRHTHIVVWRTATI